MIVAIDGPAGSGKSTIAKNTAQQLGFRYLDTGAMYRAIAARASQLGIDFDDENALAAIAEDEPVEFGFAEGEALPSRIFIAQTEVTDAIRTPQIDKAVSPVATHPSVRSALVERQRQMGRAGDFVVEGRDIGTVVFPQAEVKVFLEASAEERARRRTAQHLERGILLDYDRVLADILARDEQDSTRAVSPLAVADDAFRVDSTTMSIDEVTARVVALARAAQGVGDV